MRNDKISKIYDKFTPEERLQLTLAAAMRQDNKEMDLLIKSCPREFYKMPDIEFSDRIFALTNIANIYNYYVNHFSTLILACNAYISSYKLAYAAFNEGFMMTTSDIAKIPDEIWNEKHRQEDFYLDGVARMEECLNGHIANFKAVDEGLRLFCDDNALEFEGIVNWITSKSTFNELIIGCQNYSFIEFCPEFAVWIKNNMSNYWIE